jgi:putative transposase
MCQVLEVSTSGYYAWKGRKKSPGQVENEELLVDIRRLFMEHNQNYGSPRIWHALKLEGVPCSLNRVERLMRSAGMAAVHKRKFRVTTDSRHNLPVAANILDRNFQTDSPNKVWLSDITYVWTMEGWLYLAFVLDLYCRGVIGLSMAARMTDDLTVGALNQALLRRCPPGEMLFHSDRGSQYASNRLQDLLRAHGITPSMSRKGDCWDNAVGESLIGTLKVEKILRCRFRTREQAKREIFEYVEMYYNRKRLHSSLGYMSPFEYEKRTLQ